MGFSGGGSNVLKNHQHDGTVTSDGGALNMDNVTQATLTSGDIVYSDGVHLQRLPIGTPTQGLQVSGANLPTWGAAGGATIAVQSMNLAATFTTTAGSPTNTGMILTGTTAAGYTIISGNGSVSSPQSGHVLEMNFAEGGVQIGVRNYEKTGTTPLGGYCQWGITVMVASGIQDYTYQILTSNPVSEARVQGGPTTGCQMSIMEIS